MNIYIKCPVKLMNYINDYSLRHTNLVFFPKIDLKLWSLPAKAFKQEYYKKMFQNTVFYITHSHVWNLLA